MNPTTRNKSTPSGVVIQSRADYVPLYLYLYLTAYGGADVLLHAFLNLVLYGGEC